MSKRKKPSGDTGGYTFINIHLSTADKARLAEVEVVEVYPLTYALDLAQEGYKFSLSEDARGGGFIATLTDRRPDSPSYKCILSGRGSTPVNAWGALAYRHYQLLGEDWSEQVPDGDSGSDLFG